MSNFLRRDVFAKHFRMRTGPDESLEAEFHKRIKVILNKRDQGYVMGAFREVVSAFMDDNKEPRSLTE